MGTLSKSQVSKEPRISAIDIASISGIALKNEDKQDQNIYLYNNYRLPGILNWYSPITIDSYKSLPLPFELI